jgi:hypothetical protein
MHVSPPQLRLLDQAGRGHEVSVMPLPDARQKAQIAEYVAEGTARYASVCVFSSSALPFPATSITIPPTWLPRLSPSVFGARRRRARSLGSPGTRRALPVGWHTMDP